MASELVGSESEREDVEGAAQPEDQTMHDVEEAPASEFKLSITRAELKKAGIGQLKTWIKESGNNTDGCLEKSDLVTRLEQTEGVQIIDDV